jgi:hypothetical protein
MKLSLPFLQKKEASNHFLALLLRDEKASAVIFKEEAGKISVVGKHDEYFPNSVEHADIEEILDTLDKTISIAEETLPPNMETEKTIFGLKENWVEDGHIKKDYLAKLKKVSDELKLKPVGFLVISEAIAKLIEEEEGAPLSAIVTEVGKHTVTLTLFKAGRIIESHSSHIEDSVPKTVDALLKTFTSVEVLPSRLVVFDGERGEEIAQEFITHQWSRGLPFLHMPQVSVVPGGFDGRAVVFGAAIQMGFAVTSSIVDHTSQDIKTLASEEPGEKHSRRTKKDEDEGDEALHSEDQAKSENLVDDFPSDGDNFGFVVGKDIAAMHATHTAVAHSSEKSDDEESESKDSADIDTDVRESEQPRFAESREDSFQSSPDENDAERDFADRRSGGSKLAFLAPLAGILGVFKMVRLPKAITFASIRGGGKMLLIPPLVIIALIGLVLFYIFKLQATITLHIEPKTQEESESITFSASEENDFDASVIQAKAVSTTLDGEESIETTGKKEIGEKSKGSVTIFNNSDSKRTLAAGTVLTSSNNLEFILDKEVVIASGSGSVFTGTKPGTAQAAVTAKNIGNEYNLPSNTEFKISGAPSQVAAKNESAFSGGSKKEVRVVAKKDIQKIDEAVQNALKEKAKQELGNELSEDETLLPDFTDITLAKKTYNKKEGEETKTLTLKASVTFEGLAYSNADVTNFAKTLLKDKVSDNEDLSDESLSFDVLDIEDVSEDEMKAKLAIEAAILPKLDTQEIVEELKGKSFSDAEAYLADLPQVRESEIMLSPNIPFLPKILPRISENINVVVNTK